MDQSETNDHKYYSDPAKREEESQRHENIHQDAQQDEEQIGERNEYDSGNPHALKTLISWHGLGRPYKQRGKEYYVNIFLICAFLEVILLLFHEYLLMAVLASLVFLAYVLSVVPPRALFYKISTEGVMVEDHFYIWEELYDFYFKHIDGHDVLHIRTKWFVPGELLLVIGDVPKEHIRDILLPYLPYREYVKPTFTEKTGDWLARTFPLERR